MKRTGAILLALIMCLAMSQFSAHAEDGTWKAPSKFFNIGFAYSTLSQPGTPNLKSNFGISLTNAKTYYLHKPIAGRLRFGIEAVWDDITYSNYKVNYINLRDPEESHKENLHSLEVTMQAGVGINFNISSKSSLHGYFRYAPGLSGLYDGDKFMGGFFNGATGGLLINYRKIGVGIEGRFGQSKHKKLMAISDFTDDGPQQDDSAQKVKTKIKGLRAYISFTF